MRSRCSRVRYMRQVAVELDLRALAFDQLEENGEMSQLDLLADANTSALFNVPPEPFGVIIGPDGAIYFGDVSNHCIFRLDPSTGDTSRAVGTGDAGNSGDGGPATLAGITQPYELRYGKDGSLLFVDMIEHVVRRVDGATGEIRTVAGCGEAGFSGDGGPATQAHLHRPHSIEFDQAGALYIADIGNHRVRRVDLTASPTIETYAGTGEQQPTKVGSGLVGNPFNGPRAIAFEADGSMILVLREGNAIYGVDRAGNRVRHIAGTGEKGYAGDGGNAQMALLSGPKGMALTADGAIIIADTESHTIRRINPDGVIETLAGNGGAGTSLDPSQACLNRPHGVFVEANGCILIGDSDNRRLLRWHP